MEAVVPVQNPSSPVLSPLGHPTGVFFPLREALPQLPARQFIRHLAPSCPSKWSVEGCAASDGEAIPDGAGERGQFGVGGL